jgi:hypothetical protein
VLSIIFAHCPDDCAKNQLSEAAFCALPAFALL